MGYERIGWFDAFRAHGGPTWYGDNRTPVVTDTTTLGIVLVFGVFLLAFLVVFPGIRRERISSVVSVCLCLFVGAVLLVTIHHPGWHVGDVKIFAPYRAFTAHKLDSYLGVRVGLRHVNITLRSSDVRHSTHDLHLDYNERFHLNAVRSMEREHTAGLQKGLPYPVLSVIEYMSVDRAGFIWGRQYRLAGLCVAQWCLQVLLLCFVPAYFARSLLVLGVLLWMSDAVYVLCCPQHMSIRFPDIGEIMPVLDFRLGWCFWAVLATGAMCIIVGCVIRVLEAKGLYTFSTFLEPDFEHGQRPHLTQAQQLQHRQVQLTARSISRQIIQSTHTTSQYNSQNAHSNTIVHSNSHSHSSACSSVENELGPNDMDMYTTAREMMPSLVVPMTPGHVASGKGLPAGGGMQTRGILRHTNSQL